MRSRTRTDLATELRSKFSCLEKAVLRQIDLVGSGVSEAGTDYEEGVRAAVTTALAYGLEVLAQGPEWEGQVPAAVLTQARRAAQNGVELDTVLRRYAIGERTLFAFLVRTAERSRYGGNVTELLESQSLHLDRLLCAVSNAYRREEKAMHERPVDLLGKRVTKLLEGQPVEIAAIEYEFECWHVGLIAAGPKGAESAQALAETTGSRPLILKREDCGHWAWLGSRRRLGREPLARAVASLGGLNGSLAIGESRFGLAGWRQSHKEALLAQRVLNRSQKQVLFSSEALLIGAIMGEPEIEAALKASFLDPLEDDPHGESLREALKAYFRTGRNSVAAGAELRVDRQTVQRRVRRAEHLLGRRLVNCPEIEIALQLAELAPMPSLGTVTVNR